MDRSLAAGSPEPRQRLSGGLETPSLPLPVSHPPPGRRSLVGCLSPRGYRVAATAPHIVSMFKERRKGEEVAATASCHQGRKRPPGRAGADHAHSRRPEPGRQGLGHAGQRAGETRTHIAVVNQRDSSPGAGRGRGTHALFSRRKEDRYWVGTRAGPRRQMPPMAGKCWVRHRTREIVHGPREEEGRARQGSPEKQNQRGVRM